MSATKNINAEKIQGNLSLDSVSGFTISGGTIYSGSTDLSDLFVTSNVNVQPGININTGGTASNPIINLDDDISLNSISANTISGGTFYGDGSNLSGISTDNFYVTGGTFSSQTLTLERNDGNNVLVSGFTDFYTTGGTYDNNTSLITFGKNDGSNYDVDLTSLKFTGNTSGDCISDIYVSNIHSCSPLNINPNDEGNVYFGSTSGVTIDVLNSNVIINSLNNQDEILIVGPNKEIVSTGVLTIDPINKFVGINQNNPQVTLHMTGEGSQTAQIRIEQYDNSIDAPDIRTRKAYGTASSPSVPPAGTYLFRQNIERYNGAGWTTMHSQQFDLDGTDGTKGVYQLQTHNGSSLATRYSINKDGDHTLNGDVNVTGVLNIGTINSGTIVNNLGYDSSGNVIIGSTTTDTNTFVSGGTYNTGTQEINFVGNSVETTFDVDLSSIISVDTYVTGFTFNPSTYDLTIKQNEGQPDLVSNLAVLASDVYVVSGVYNPATGVVTYTNSTGGTFQVSGFTTGMTDSYTTAANLNGETIEFDNNIQGSNLYSVNLSPVLSGKTDLTLFDAHTGDTNNPHQTTFGNLISTAHTHTISDVTNLQTELNSKIENGINSGGGNEVFSGKSGTDLYFRTFSGGTNTTITTIGDIINIDVTTSNMPQAQKLYVDSENGTNVTTSGELGQPFLTPEYALNQIDNTGSITGDTNSNTTISGISDIDNDKLEVGMYLYGSGVLFGSVIVSKGNEGSDSNTITISKNVSSSNTNVSIDFVKIYELVLNGTFSVSSRTLFKEGVWIRNNGLVNYSTYNLFNLGTQVLKTPYKILGNGDYNGLDNIARFISASATQLAGFTLDIEFGNIYTIYTGVVFNVNTGSNKNYVNIKGNFVQASFGTVGTFQSYSPNVDFDSYGLLGGITIATLGSSSTGCAGTLKGNHETPIAVTVANVGQMISSTANLYGNTIWSYSTHTGKLRGTTHTLSGGSSLNIKQRSSVGTISGGGTIYMSDGSGANINVASGTNWNLYGSGFVILGYAALDGTIYNYGYLQSGTNLTGTGKIYNFGVFNYAWLNSTFSGEIHNHSEMYMNAWTSGSAKLINYHKLYLKQYGITLTGSAELINKGIIESYGAFTNNSAMIELNSATCKFDNYGIINMLETDITKATIEKTAGTLYLRQGSYINQSNGLSPIRCTANTSDSKDVYYFGVTTNCDGTTYGLTFAYDGAAFSPNDLAGGTLFENTNY